MLQKRIALFATTALLVGSTLVIAPSFAQATQNTTVVQTDLSAATVYDNVSPSVVAINVYMPAQTNMQQMPSNPFGNPLDPNQVPQQSPQDQGLQEASGSGFVLDEQGHIVTNAHVVKDATRIEVNFLDGTMAQAKLVGIDTDSDIAVIQVDLPAEKLYPVTLGDSQLLDIGQQVLAIGSPFGERWTLTEGIVSALDRTISGLNQFSIGGVIQTDAAINPGNSGGPLLNMQGEVIGMNSQIESGTRSNAGIGFAIPSNLVKYVANELINTGFISYSYLGIQGGNINLALIETLGLPNDFKGVVVGAVANGGPAERAGLQSASDETDVDGLQVPQKVDIITAINGVPMNNMPDLVEYVATQTKPGDEVTIDILRNGTDKVQVTARLTPRPTN